MTSESDIEKKLSELEHKFNLIIEQQQATQRAIALLRGEVNKK